MPTKFRDFFKLEPGADPFQQRIYQEISNATTMVDCYRRLYLYIISGVKWSSRKFRKESLDKNVDLRGINQQQMDDANAYFADLVERDRAVWFEFLEMIEQREETYGANVFSLEITSANRREAEKAFEQLRLYWKAQIYNANYERQLRYSQEKHRPTAPPNDRINFNPSAPLDGDHLKHLIEDLVSWILNNYDDSKAVIETDTAGLFDLVFGKSLPIAQQINAVETMLNRIHQTSYFPPVDKEFAQWAIEKLNTGATFWGNTNISKAYVDIQKREIKFKAEGFLSADVFYNFQTLFGDFLSSKQYAGESEDDAKRRATDAFRVIEQIFRGFTSKQAGGPAKFVQMMADALKMIKEEYQKFYTSNLLRAFASVQKFKQILPDEVADLLKKTADECLKSLPLRLLNKTEVRLFAFQNYEDLKALNSKVEFIKNPNRGMSIKVIADPLEKNRERYRPLYRLVFKKGDSLDRYTAFCNAEDKDGIFYYVHVNNPSVVDVPTIDDEELIRTIDFHDYTITYDGKKKNKTEDDFGQLYRDSGKTTHFHEELRTTTKWTTIDGRRRYEPYYTTNPTRPEKPVAHLTGFVGAAWTATRTLPLGDDSLCLWAWNASSDRAKYLKLGEILGLPTSREILPAGSNILAQLPLNIYHLVNIGNVQCNFKNYGCVPFPNGFRYQIISIVKTGEAEQFYVQVNTPVPGVAATLTQHRTAWGNESVKLEDDPRTILDYFDFKYFRRITTTLTSTGQPVVTEMSKVIQLFKKGDTRTPAGPGIEEIPWPDKQFVAVGLKLPICFNLPDNIIQYFEDKRRRGKLINKGNTLYRSDKARKDAATAMAPIHKYLRPPMSTTLSRAKVPANDFANEVIAQSQWVREDWGKFQLATGNYMPVTQEWCHLRGHGDGGDEYPGNFVSGSYHCNSEQLAIETGQRLVTQQTSEDHFLLHTTAYLLRDAFDYESTVESEKQSQILTDNYLLDHQTYTDMVKSNTNRRKGDVDDKDDVKKTKTTTGSIDRVHPDERLPLQGTVAPVAAYIRYKVMRDPVKKRKSSKKRKRTDVSKTRRKFFDFIFEGQSEFVDVYQSSIISRAVQFTLAGLKAFNDWYEVEKSQLEEN